MNILQVGPNSVHVSSFIAAMAKQGIQQDLLTEEAVQVEGVNRHVICSFRSANPLLWLITFFKLGKILQQLSPDCIHIHQANRLAFFVSWQAKRKRIPVVLTAWGSDVLLVPKKNRFYRYLVKKTLDRSRIVTADSTEMIESMKALVSSKPYEWIQYGIDPVQPASKEKLIFSNRLHQPLYRIDQVIRYFEAFANKHEDWKLIIAGSGSETENLKQLAESLTCSDRVQFVGWLSPEENRAWYAKASMYISIPSSDGTSVSVLEAMSAGCIPILPDLPVSYEWIDATTGIIERPGENPIQKALTLDIAHCKQQNQDRISMHALRTVSCTRFFQFYQESVAH